MGKSAILTIPFLLLLGGVFSLLYRNGHLTVCTKKAVLFCGTYRRASVSSCSAVLRRVIRFREGGLHHFEMDAALQRGEWQVCLFDAKQPAFVLDSLHPSACLDAEEGRRYLLVITLRSATGRYSLTWD